MKIAVTYENGQVFQHFGHSRQFKVYETDGQKVLSEEVLDTNGSGHGALAGFLKQAGVQVLICGGIGPGAKTALEEVNIKLYGGVSGEADKKVAELLKGSLNFNPVVSCSHHGEGHSEGGSCKNHCH